MLGKKICNLIHIKRRLTPAIISEGSILNKREPLIFHTYSGKKERENKKYIALFDKKKSE